MDLKLHPKQVTYFEYYLNLVLQVWLPLSDIYMPHQRPPRGSRQSTLHTLPSILNRSYYIQALVRVRLQRHMIHTDNDHNHDTSDVPKSLVTFVAT
jgi:hypothetical protein